MFLVIKDGFLQNNVQCIIHHVDIKKLKSLNVSFSCFCFLKKKKLRAFFIFPCSFMIRAFIHVLYYE